MEPTPSNPVITLTTESLALSLASTVCPACGKVKKAGVALCVNCMLQLQVWQRVHLNDVKSRMYAHHVASALDVLKATAFHLPPAAPAPAADAPPPAADFEAADPK